MHIVFADDAKQQSPSRPGMSSLVAVGGFCIDADRCQYLEGQLEDVCQSAGFSEGEEFKWSPRRDTWMHGSLLGDARTTFFLQVLNLLGSAGARAAVVVEDTRYQTATRNASTHELDATHLFLERVDFALGGMHSTGIVVADRPGGGRTDEDAFLVDCADTIQSGTDYVELGHVAMNVLTTPSRHVRLLQAADLITSGTLAHVGGEGRYSPKVFQAVRDMMLGWEMRRGGIGLKIHPDVIYANLYHWLLADQSSWRQNVGVRFPLLSQPYSQGPNTP